MDTVIVGLVVWVILLTGGLIWVLRSSMKELQKVSQILQKAEGE